MNDKINYILEDIYSHLKNDYDKDIAYLESMFEKYNGYRYEKELFRKINEILVKMKFQNEFKDLEKLTRKEESKYNTICERAEEFISNGKMKDAKKILEKFITQVRQIYGDNNNIYVSLYGRVEYNLFKKFYKPCKKVYNININADKMYEMYAKILISENQLDSAVKYLLEAININPVSTKIYYTLADAYRRQGKLKEFKEAVDIAFRYTYKIEDLAKYYIYRAYLCIVAKKSDYASALLSLAHHYKATKEDVDMLYKFAASVNETIKRDTLKEAVALISQTKIPIGASRYVYEVLVSLYTHTKDIYIKELYRSVLLEYTKSGAYKERIKLSKGKDETKDIDKLIKTIYKTKCLTFNKKEEERIVFFDFCTYFPNVIENMIKFEYGIDKHTVQASCNYEILQTPCKDCKFKKCPVYLYCKKAEEIKDLNNEYVNMLDFSTIENIRENKKENIQEVEKEINRNFKDIISIKAAEVIINAGFIRDVKLENNVLEYTELNFENTTKENKIIETMQSFYKKEVGETKKIKLAEFKHHLKENTSCIFKESPYVAAAYITYICKVKNVDESIVLSEILEKYDGDMSIKDLMYTRSVMQKMHNINVGRELEKKLKEMIVYIAAYSKSKNKLPYITFNISINRCTEALAMSLKNIIVDVVKYFKYNKELEIKVIKYEEDLKGSKWYAKKQEISKDNTFVIMYGEKVKEDSMFNITATAKEYTKKEIAKQIMLKLESTYPCANDLETYIENYVEKDYKESELENLEYINHLYKRFVYNTSKKEENKKVITEKEIY